MWVQNIQRAIDYIEENLCDDISIEDVAKEAYSSTFHFQRVFSILCGFTVSDYIRNRRLANAALDLLDENTKVIDVAFKYGYDTPESFTRAFKNFHNVNPLDVKKGASFKTFSKLSVKLILEGGSKMEYRIEKLPKIKFLCKRKIVNKPEDAKPSDIMDFWSECNKDGTIEKIIKYFNPNAHIKGLVGACFTYDMSNMKFPYGIGIEYDKDENVDGLDIVEIPAYTYTVFKCVGPMPYAFTDTYKKIVTEFFPQNDKFEYAYGLEFEVYPSDKVNDKDYTCEIWIAVKEKSK